MNQSPKIGTVVHVVDQTGATFALATIEAAWKCAVDESRRGAENLTVFDFVVPRDGMTWDEIADAAASVGWRS